MSALYDDLAEPTQLALAPLARYRTPALVVHELVAPIARRRLTEREQGARMRRWLATDGFDAAGDVLVGVVLVLALVLVIAQTTAIASHAVWTYALPPEALLHGRIGDAP